MAQLNGYTNSEGNLVAIVPRPVNKYSPNGISRITPKLSRDYAKLAYKAWTVLRAGVREETGFSGIQNGAAAWVGGSYITFTNGTADGYIWFTVDAAGADPTPGGTNLGVVAILSTDTAVEIARKLHNVLNTLSNTTSTWTLPLIEVNVRNDIPGVRTDATLGTVSGTLMTVTVTAQGVNPDTTPWNGTYTDHEGAQNLTYFDE